ncbi:copper transport protein ATOX1-like isoform X1 [Mytilus galloprovincialis]|uniref:Copper transport protein ATOX1 n=2 Tax=Mytilus galloprovincialis TaxID=29158 RepID=A0A8B6D2Y5_MYTGA|nr:copper chaperone [Mytilus galloprovincialis]
MSQTYQFNMEMTCEGCANAAKRVLGKQGDKVTEVVTDVPTKTVTVTSTLSADEVLEVLKKTNIAVSLKGC